MRHDEVHYLAGRFRMPLYTTRNIMKDRAYLAWWLRNTDGPHLTPGGIYDLARLRGHDYHTALNILLESVRAIAL